MLVSCVIITGMALPRLSSFGPEGTGCPPLILRFKSKGQLHLRSPEIRNVGHRAVFCVVAFVSHPLAEGPDYTREAQSPNHTPSRNGGSGAAFDGCQRGRF